MVRAIMCPQCNAPLSPHRFASSIVCAYCGTTVRLDPSFIPASTFHQAFRVWNAPETYNAVSWISLGDRHWALERLLAQGDVSDVYAGRLIRWPTELVILKVLREEQGRDRLENEWGCLQALHESEAAGADTFTTLLPQPVVHGDLASGAFAGHVVSIFRWASGYQYTFEEVFQAYPEGIPARTSIWVWRRILEVLSFIHASGMVHGAVLPPHLLVHDSEHGVRLVGYGHAGRLNEKADVFLDGYEEFYPQPVESWNRLSTGLDVVMSARCIAAILGGDPETAALPEAVPAPLADLIQRVALADLASAAREDAWAVREELGRIARKVFGPPQYIPIMMPPSGPKDLHGDNGGW